MLFRSMNHHWFSGHCTQGTLEEWGPQRQLGQRVVGTTLPFGWTFCLLVMMLSWSTQSATTTTTATMVMMAEAFAILPQPTSTTMIRRRVVAGRLFAASDDNNNNNNNKKENGNDTTTTSTTTATTETTKTSTLPYLTESEQAVYDFFHRLHETDYEFRIIVVGTNNGAILETTASLGPTFKLNASPKTGKALLTMATLDQSFEFHLTLQQVHKLELAKRPKKGHEDEYLRVLRFLSNTDDTVVCALLLVDQSDEAVTFFQALMDVYGSGYIF